jgi:hypothetical protein
MANPLYDKGLEEARGNLRSLIDKSETLQRSGGNLDKNGEPSLTARRGDVSFTSGGRDEGAAARSSMRGPEQFTRTPGNRLPSSDAHITGQVGGGETRRPNQMTWGEGPEPKKPEEAMIRSSRLNVPAVRPMRPANEAGATSFHFSHEAISKTRAEKITARGTKNRAGAASAHTSYIERDSAVAKVEKGDQNRIAEDLADQAKSNPELAAQLGIADDDSERAPESLVERDDQPLGTGALASAYIEREEALAHEANGAAVLFSNISESADERREFWQLVEEAESGPSSRRASSPAFLSANPARCPSNTTNAATASRSCSAASRIGVVWQRDTTAAQPSSSPHLLWPPQCSSGCDQRVLSLSQSGPLTARPHMAWKRSISTYVQPIRGP